MKKLFRKNEVVRFKNEEQKKQLLDIAVKYGIKWGGGVEPFEYKIPNLSVGICFNKGLHLGFTLSNEGYKVISTKKFLKRFDKETKLTFKPVFMKCKRKTFDKMRPKLESIGCRFVNFAFSSKTYLINNYTNNPLFISADSIDFFEQGDRTEVHTEAEFLEACGYVEEVYEPKVGDFGLFWDDDFDIDEQNIMGYIKEVRINNSFKTICNEIYDNFTPLPKETKDIYNRIKNK